MFCLWPLFAYLTLYKPNLTSYFITKHFFKDVLAGTGFMSPGKVQNSFLWLFQYSRKRVRSSHQWGYLRSFKWNLKDFGVNIALQIIGIGGSDWFLNSAVIIQNNEYSGIPSFWMPGAAPLVLWTNQCNMSKFTYNVICYYMHVFNVVSNNSPKSFIGGQHWAWNNIKIRTVEQEAKKQRSKCH